jgi:hypothetical protein
MKFVRSLKLKGRTDWLQYCKSGKLPKDIPANPPRTYKKEWESWGEFLGTGRIANQNIVWPSAKEARIEIRKIAKDVFGGKPFTPKDWINAHKEGKISTNLPRYLQDIYDPDYRKRRKK